MLKLQISTFLKFTALLLYCQCDELEKKDTFRNWKFFFPESSTMGLLLAVAIPLTLPRNSAYLAFNWEANYVLPDNVTDFNYPPIIQKRIDRQLVYNAFETKLKKQGYSGRDCLLRAICEASVETLWETNGVLGDILHIILTPSSSKNFKLSKAYQVAELNGHKNQNCIKYENCPISFLDLISWLQHM